MYIVDFSVARRETAISRRGMCVSRREIHISRRAMEKTLGKNNFSPLLLKIRQLYLNFIKAILSLFYIA